MDEQNNDASLDAALKERFASLPKVVQDAINSAEVEEHLRTLAKTSNLHVDQWQVLENNVMLTLLGFQPVGELAVHLEKDLSIPTATATDLATKISSLVFDPIRGEMERSLQHPDLVPTAATEMETVRAQALTTETATAAPQPQTPAVAPGTPPAPAPETKAARVQIAPSYAGTVSHERKTIEGDPYREQIS